MKNRVFLLFTAMIFAGSAWGQLSDQSFLSVSAPGNCNTADNAIVTAQQLFGSGSGFGCLRTLIFPQFSVGDGWTTQVTGFLPVQPVTAGLVTGTVPGFAAEVRAGSAAMANPNNGKPVLISAAYNGCLGFWDSVSGQALIHADAVIDSGGAQRLNYTSLATRGKCTGGADLQIAGNGAGPMQVQIVAPTAMAVAQATPQLTYFYDGGTFQWQVTVNAVDINAAKAKWTAPLYQGGDYNYVTAFSVVNASNTAQTVSISLRDDNGVAIGSAMSTPMLDPGCGCNQWGQSAAGGYFAATVTDLFGDLGPRTGSIEFQGTGPIVVIVLRTIKGSLGSVPAR